MGVGGCISNSKSITNMQHKYIKKIKRYKVNIGKKYITVIPKPLIDIKNGLKVKFQKETDLLSAYTTTDIIKGKQRYFKPKDSRQILEAYIQQ